MMGGDSQIPANFMTMKLKAMPSLLQNGFNANLYNVYMIELKQGGKGEKCVWHFLRTCL